MVKGLGTDIIEISRIRRAVERYGSLFVDRLFTVRENAYCLSFRDPAPRYAGRFAAKEAIIKALMLTDYQWLEIEIVNGDNGAPYPVLSERLEMLFSLPKLIVSISHCREYATATAILLS